MNEYLDGYYHVLNAFITEFTESKQKRIVDYKDISFKLF